MISVIMLSNLAPFWLSVAQKPSILPMMFDFFKSAITELRVAMVFVKFFELSSISESTPVIVWLRLSSRVATRSLISPNSFASVSNMSSVTPVAIASPFLRYSVAAPSLISIDLPPIKPALNIMAFESVGILYFLSTVRLTSTPPFSRFNSTPVTCPTFTPLITTAAASCKPPTCS